AHLRAVQAPVIYEVNDPADSWQSYRAKFTRWLVLPRRAMEPFLTTRQRMTAFLATPATILLPSVLGAVALVVRRRVSLVALAASIGVFAGTQAISYLRFFRPKWCIRQEWPTMRGGVTQSEQEGSTWPYGSGNSATKSGRRSGGSARRGRPPCAPWSG